MSTLTSANSVLLLSIANLYPTPQAIQGYAVDDAFAVEDIQPGETAMGVDGKLSAGYVPQPYDMTIMLQADSASCQVFDDWFNAEKSAKEKYESAVQMALSGVNQKYSFKKGYLIGYSPSPAAKKILQPRKFVIRFEDRDQSPV